MSRFLSLLTLHSLLVSRALSMSNTVILGGGIHGVSIAYHLAIKYNMKSIIVEQSAIASAASGKSGGFLAREWGQGPTRALHEISYDMHKQLATTLHLETYREIPTLSVDGSRKGTNTASWLDQKVTSSLMDSNTGQVTSKELVEKMLQAAIDTVGTEVVIDGAVGVDTKHGKVTAVRLQSGQTITANKIIICLGPWSSVAVEDWFGLPLPMEGIKSTSIVYHGIEEIKEEPYACFCAEDRQGCHMELYPRPNGDLYICGLGGSDYVSGDRLRAGGDCASSELIKEDPTRVTAAVTSIAGMSSAIAKRTPDVTQACMRPCTTDGLPVMGAIPGVDGAYISTGHNCWGILWAPVSGLCMAELIVTGSSSTVDLRPFDPCRYMSQPLKDRARGKKKGALQVGEQW